MTCWRRSSGFLEFQIEQPIGVFRLHDCVDRPLDFTPALKRGKWSAASIRRAGTVPGEGKLKLVRPSVEEYFAIR